MHLRAPSLLTPSVAFRKIALLSAEQHVHRVSGRPWIPSKHTSGFEETFGVLPWMMHNDVVEVS